MYLSWFVNVFVLVCEYICLGLLNYLSWFVNVFVLVVLNIFVLEVLNIWWRFEGWVGGSLLAAKTLLDQADTSICFCSHSSSCMYTCIHRFKPSICVYVRHQTMNVTFRMLHMTYEKYIPAV